MLSAKNLTKTYGNKVALNDLSLTIAAGQITALLGANGAGKSTTLNLLLHFIQADSGTVFIDGQPVDSNNKRSIEQARRQMAYLPEQVNLYQQFNPIENLQYLTSLNAINCDRQRIEQALLQTGLDQQTWRKPLADFSKGMRQKVAIAHAIVSEAKILLLDEPTSGLDPSASKEFVSIIAKLVKQGTGVLLVTHDLDCAESLANEIMILDHGHVVDKFLNQQLSPGELKQRYFQAIDGVAANATTTGSAHPQYA